MSHETGKVEILAVDEERMYLRYHQAKDLDDLGEARGWRSAYFSQPIFEPDRSLFSPGPSPLVPRQRGQSANSLGKWRARQDSNLRPSA